MHYSFEEVEYYRSGFRAKLFFTQKRTFHFDYNILFLSNTFGIRLRERIHINGARRQH